MGTHLTVARRARVLLLACAALPGVGFAGDEQGPAAAASAGDASWGARVALNAYLLPGEADYAQPTAAVDRGALHLEARYNYEAQRTGSVWLGWNLEWGDSVKVALTPMLGAVLGDVGGVAPGVEWSLTWGPVELYSENEVVVDLADSSRSYFYAWSELGGQPLEWLRVGLALQRTRALSSPLEVQWGPFAGASVGRLLASAYWFNPGRADARYWVASLGATF